MEEQTKVFPLAPVKKYLLGMEAGKFCLVLFLATAEILNTKLNLFSSSMMEFNYLNKYDTSLDFPVLKEPKD